MNTEFHELVISSIEPLTRDSIAISFDVPVNLAKHYRYIQGQHLTLEACINGNKIRRSYSICNGVVNQQLTIAIKKIEKGIFSHYAHENFVPGMVVRVMVPQGRFYLPLSSENEKNYLLIAVGSGITPILSHVQSILQVEPGSRVTLIYGNRSLTEMMFRNRLCFIKNKYLKAFHWINIFTQEKNEIALFNGRIDAQKIEALNQSALIDVEQFDELFICGPESVVNSVSDYLLANKTESEKIHYELFYTGKLKQVEKKNKSDRKKKYGDHTSRVSLKISGRKSTLEISTAGVSILDVAVDNGIDLPFSCKGGVCATCKARVVFGEVEMDNNHSLTKEEIEEGMILTCQSHPVSEKVEIDFDFS